MTLVFLKHDIHPHSYSDFSIERNDRDDRPRGGVAIIIRKALYYEVLPQIYPSIFESIGIEININKNTIIKIISTYLPGGTSNSLINQHFANDINKLTNYTNSYFIFGDFNAKHRLMFM